MVVDDSLTVRRVTQRLLEREGYRVLLAKDGVDALEQMQEVRPDLMLVDIEMPRMDGFDLTRHVRGDAATPRGADHHDHLAHGGQAPQLCAGAGRECLLRQAVPGAGVAGGVDRGLAGA
jgi:CheY-like chemotaxis protein